MVSTQCWPSLLLRERTAPAVARWHVCGALAAIGATTLAFGFALFMRVWHLAARRIQQRRGRLRRAGRLDRRGCGSAAVLPDLPRPSAALPNGALVRLPVRRRRPLRPRLVGRRRCGDGRPHVQDRSAALRPARRRPRSPVPGAHAVPRAGLTAGAARSARGVLRDADPLLPCAVRSSRHPVVAVRRRRRARSHVPLQRGGDPVRRRRLCVPRTLALDQGAPARPCGVARGDDRRDPAVPALDRVRREVAHRLGVPFVPAVSAAEPQLLLLSDERVRGRRACASDRGRGRPVRSFDTSATGARGSCSPGSSCPRSSSSSGR